MLSKKNCLLFTLAIGIFSAYGQTNTSQEINYKARQAGFHPYTTEYDNGYVTLLDGTQLEGKISLVGNAYDNVYGIRIKTNSGEKYSFIPRSLSAYGLSNSIVNDTPGAFYWVEVDRGISKFMTGTSGGNKAVSEGRNGYTDFGYVTLKNGKTYEGRIDIKEVKQKIRKFDVKTADKEKYSFDAEEVSNFGVKQYKDPKFIGPLGILETGYKSQSLPGFVETTSGQKQTGYIQVSRKGEFTSQVQLRASEKGKATRYKYEDIKTYGIDVTKKHWKEALERGNVAYDLIHPELKFFPGTLTLSDGTKKEGLVAKTALSTLSDVYFLENEDAPLQYYASDELEFYQQNLPPATMEAYEKQVYEATHVNGHLIDQTTRWRYKTQNEGSSRTEYMWGYLRLADGSAQVGDVSVKSVGALTTYFLRKKNGEEIKYKGKEVVDYGLLTSEAYTPFPNSVFASQRPGWLWLTDGDAYLYGDLEITVRANDDGALNRYFKLTSDGQSQEYVETKVSVYGVSDATIDELTNGGTIAYEEPRRNFRKATITNAKGDAYSGWLAYADNRFNALYFTSDPSKPVTIQYGDQLTNISFNEEEVMEVYDPLDDNFLASASLNESVQNNGYVITSSGEKIEGQIALSFPPELPFATDVTLTKSDGSVVEYTNDGSLSKIVVTVNGQEKEFINYENDYAEVLHRYENLVHFRNPHPTTNKIIGEAANQMAAEALEGVETSINNSFGGNGGSFQFNGANGQDIDWDNAEIVTLYAKEYIILDETTKKVSIYIPNRTYLQIEGDLMGSIEYLQMEKEQQKGLKKMQNPMVTMKFLHSKVYNQ
ncbi:hypothetical protein E1176_19195 [Fulvivirga sp. RKSG066]|uniref:hypothetical protein n=1 Tax=Fulvivirga aurantia TaxID=2529383 RepID=UPI0012BD4B6D|nr:hypothetical protein [Fulvivirga aurantia]MTI23164.1 hypothetical protein [Fulvivirga aurantia]